MIMKLLTLESAIKAKKILTELAVQIRVRVYLKVLFDLVF
jgi:hypothetical protein